MIMTLKSHQNISLLCVTKSDVKQYELCHLLNPTLTTDDNDDDDDDDDDENKRSGKIKGE